QRCHHMAAIGAGLAAVHQREIEAQPGQEFADRARRPGRRRKIVEAVVRFDTALHDGGGAVRRHPQLLAARRASVAIFAATLRSVARSRWERAVPASLFSERAMDFLVRKSSATCCNSNSASSSPLSSSA